MRHRVDVAVLAWAMLATAGLQAQTISNDELRAKGYAGAVELGFNKTTGNSDTRGYHTALSVEQMLAEWRNQYSLESSFKKDGEATSEERYFASGQGNRHYSETTYALARAAYENDRFNGLEDAVTASVGVGYLLLEAEHYHWDIEAGPGYRYNAAQQEESEAILRLASTAWYHISDTSRLRQQLSAEGGKENIISRSETSLTASIIGQLALKLSLVATYQSKPANGSDGQPKEARESKTLLTLLYDF